MEGCSARPEPSRVGPVTAQPPEIAAIFPSLPRSTISAAGIGRPVSGLTKTGPRGNDARTRKAQGLLEVVPFLEKPAARKKEAVDNFELDEISSILAACHAADAPRYLDGRARETWWQSLVLFAYNTALRIGSLTIVRWSAFEQDRKDLWWVRVRVKGGATKRVHCNAYAMEAVEAMRPLTGQFDRVWHFPHVHSWLQENRRRILLASGLPPDRQFGFHGFRKACATQGSADDALGTQMQLGHKDWATTQDSYINPARAAAAMANLPQPKHPTRGPRQLDLF